jgi:diamine N-acetyltransferase
LPKFKHMPAMNIIPCNAGDVQTLAGVAVQSYLEEYPYLWHDGGQWYIQRCFAEPVLINELRQPNHAWFLLKEGNATVGYLKLNITNPLPGYESYDSLELERIYLLNVAKGKGYGRLAVEFCEQYAQRLNKDIIWLKAMDDARHPAFYKKMGYSLCGTYLLDYELMKEELRGMVVMMKRRTV